MTKANEPEPLIFSLKYLYLKNVTFPVLCFQQTCTEMIFCNHLLKNKKHILILERRKETPKSFRQMSTEALIDSVHQL